MTIKLATEVIFNAFKCFVMLENLLLEVRARITHQNPTTMNRNSTCLKLRLKTVAIFNLLICPIEGHLPNNSYMH